MVTRQLATHSLTLSFFPPRWNLLIEDCFQTNINLFLCLYNSQGFSIVHQILWRTCCLVASGSRSAVCKLLLPIFTAGKALQRRQLRSRGKLINHQRFPLAFHSESSLQTFLLRLRASLAHFLRCSCQDWWLRRQPRILSVIQNGAADLSTCAFRIQRRTRKMCIIKNVYIREWPSWGPLIKIRLLLAGGERSTMWPKSQW